MDNGCASGWFALAGTAVAFVLTCARDVVQHIRGRRSEKQQVVHRTVSHLLQLRALLPETDPGFARRYLAAYRKALAEQIGSQIGPEMIVTLNQFLVRDVLASIKAARDQVRELLPRVAEATAYVEQDDPALAFRLATYRWVGGIFPEMGEVAEATAAELAKSYGPEAETGFHMSADATRSAFLDKMVAALDNAVRGLARGMEKSKRKAVEDILVVAPVLTDDEILAECRSRLDTVVAVVGLLSLRAGLSE